MPNGFRTALALAALAIALYEEPESYSSVEPGSRKVARSARRWAADMPAHLASPPFRAIAVRLAGVSLRARAFAAFRTIAARGMGRFFATGASITPPAVILPVMYFS